MWHGCEAMFLKDEMRNDINIRSNFNGYFKYYDEYNDGVITEKRFIKQCKNL